MPALPHGNLLPHDPINKTHMRIKTYKKNNNFIDELINNP